MSQDNPEYGTFYEQVTRLQNRIESAENEGKTNAEIVKAFLDEVKELGDIHPDIKDRIDLLQRVNKMGNTWNSFGNEEKAQELYDLARESLTYFKEADRVLTEFVETEGPESKQTFSTLNEVRRIANFPLSSQSLEDKKDFIDTELELARLMGQNSDEGENISQEELNKLQDVAKEIGLELVVENVQGRDDTITIRDVDGQLVSEYNVTFDNDQVKGR